MKTYIEYLEKTKNYMKSIVCNATEKLVVLWVIQIKSK